MSINSLKIYPQIGIDHLVLAQLLLLSNEFLNLESSHAPRASRGNRLPVALVLNITSSEHALD